MLTSITWIDPSYTYFHLKTDLELEIETLGKNTRKFEQISNIPIKDFIRKNTQIISLTIKVKKEKKLNISSVQVFTMQNENVLWVVVHQ